jgi:hypothetical protein
MTTASAAPGDEVAGAGGSEQALTRVERDGRGLRTTFEEFEVGASLGEFRWSIEPANAAGLIDNDQDAHPWYVGESPFGGPIVPPMATYPPVRILFTRNYNVRGLFYHFESEFREPIPYGEDIIVTGHISDKWISRDREYVAYEAEGRLESGLLLFSTRRAHVLDFIKRTVPRGGEGLDSGAAQAQP